jgi:hypothetical protein
MYNFLNIFFFIFHTTLILFILVGWVWRPLRKVHLAMVILTALSWFGLGVFYGFGYCPCTDWHWMVREHLGYTDMPRSYIKFLIDIPTGWNLNDDLVDIVTVTALALVSAASIYVNLPRRKK